jgi:hypothetical protein
LEKTETLDTILGMEEQQGWCTLRYRDGGFVYRGEEDTYYRDGTFSKQYHRSYGYSRSEGPYTVPLGDLSVYAGEQGGLSDYSTDGEVVDLDGHVYVKIPILGGYYEIKPETLLEFTFIGLTEGDVHAVGFDLNDSVEAPIILFQVWGSDPGSVVGGAVNTEFDDYPGGGGEMSFSIPVGQYFPGEWVSHLVVLQDDEVSETASCRIKDVVLREQRDTEPDYIWGRSECNEITDPTHLVFERPDIPGVWFPSLEAMTNPAVLDLPDLPGPEQ